MPTIEVDKHDLKDIIKKKMSEDRLEEVLFLLGVEIEEKKERKWKLEIDPDRPDLFSVEGIGRAIKSFLHIHTGLRNYNLRKGSIKLKNQGSKSRPCVSAAVVRNIGGGIRSLMRLQEKLHQTLGRNRKKVAIGIHDLGDIKPPLKYRDVSPKQKFRPLDGDSEMTLNEILEKHPKGIKYKKLLKNQKKYPVFFDKNDNIISFPPIINSELTRVKEDTKDIFIDVTGTNQYYVDKVLKILVSNMGERGSEIETVDINGEISPDIGPEEMDIKMEYINSMLGLDLNIQDIKELGRRMGYDLYKREKGIKFLIPPYRANIIHPVDIIEDIAIAYGYNNFTTEIPNLFTVGNIKDKEKYTDKTRELMVGLGFQETISFTLTKRDNLTKMMEEKNEPIRLKNPVSENYDSLRNWLLPSLMEVLASNKHRRYPQKIFETGDVVLVNNKKDEKTEKRRKLAGAVSHSKSSFTEIKGHVETLLNNLGIKYNFKERKYPFLINGRRGKILSRNKTIGFFGEIHPKILVNWDLEKPVTCFEIDLEKIRT